MTLVLLISICVIKYQIIANIRGLKGGLIKGVGAYSRGRLFNNPVSKVGAYSRVGAYLKEALNRSFTVSTYYRQGTIVMRFLSHLTDFGR